MLAITDTGTCKLILLRRHTDALCRAPNVMGYTCPESVVRLTVLTCLPVPLTDLQSSTAGWYTSASASPVPIGFPQ